MEKLKGLDLEGKRVLDAGTGACGMTKFLENWGAEVVSIDVEEEWQRDCRSQTKRSEFVTADLSSLDFLKDESFDYVVCNFLVSALSETKQMILSQVFREFYRVLKNNGMLVVIDYYPFEEETCPSPCHEIQVELWRLENALSELLGEGHLEEYHPDTLREELLNIGFSETDESILLEHVPWPLDLLKEHEEGIEENLERLDDEHMKGSFSRRLNRLMDRAEKEEIRSGAIYELRSMK